MDFLFKSKTAKEMLRFLSISLAAFFFSLAVSHGQKDPLEHSIFTQTNFLVPSVFFAAGKGLGTADIDSIPNLKAFITKQKSYFDKINIPEGLHVQPLKTELETQHLYYLYTIGWLWRIFGISLNVLVCYSALWRAFNAGAVYAIFRCFMSPAWSICGALFFLTSPLVFHPIIGLREQGSVPFMLGVIWGIVFLIRSCKSRRSYLFSSAMLGILIGIGTGFRGEATVYIPTVLATLFFFPEKQSDISLKLRLQSEFLFVTLLLITLFPLTNVLDSTHAHSFFAGISPDTERSLSFGDASYQSLPPTDPAAYAMITTFARCQGDTKSMVNVDSSEYARNQGNKDAPLLWDPFLFFNGAHYRHCADQLMMKIISCTPADLVARAWYGMLCLPTALFRVMTDMEDIWKDSPLWLRSLLFVHTVLGNFQSKLGFLCICLILLICSIFNYKKALFWTVLLAWVSGYSTFDYEFRNYYFLAFVPILILFLAASRIVQCVQLFYLKIKEKHFRVLFKEGVAALKRPLIFTSFILLAVIAPVLVLRSWQVHAISSIARELAGASLQEVETVSSLSEGACLVSPKETLPGLINASSLPAGETAWQYVAVEVDTHGKDIPLTIRYNSRQIMYDFSQTVTLFGIPDGKKGSLLFFFPVYEVDMNYGGTLMPSEILDIYPHVKDVVDSDVPIEEQQWWRRGKFEGITVPEEYRQHIRKMYVVSPDEGFCWLPIFQLPEDSRYLRCYKTGSLEKTFGRWLKSLKSV